jgi:hypothetical protein
MVENKAKVRRARTVNRTCTGCGKVTNKREMLRIVKTPDGEIIHDLKGKIPGRGAYICYDINCVEMAFKKGLAKTLKHNISDNFKNGIISIISDKENRKIKLNIR